MPQVNLSQIQARLSEEAAKSYLAVEGDPDSVLALALAGVNLNDVNIIVVPNIEQLPNLKYTSFPDGMIYFVNDVGIFAISSNYKWLTLDGVLLRTDILLGLTWSWGSNSQGQLGDNTTISRSSPVSVVSGFCDWSQVSAGGSFSLAIRQSGTAWAWGFNACGQLGDNTTANRSSPVSVAGGFTDWCQVAAGSNHSLALRQESTLWAWGLNTCGQLGTNTAGFGTSRSSPVSVVGGFTDWCQVSAGSQHSLAIRQSGTAWAWGYNRYGQLGDNSTTNRSSPVSVVGGFTDWCQVSAGGSFSLAIRQSGTAWAWGLNRYGRLGDNTTVSKSSPVSVVGGFTDWCQVSAGTFHSLGVRQSGTAWAWGSNAQGQLGDNTTVSKSSPVSVVGGFADWCQVSAGGDHSLALRQSGTAWAWGCSGQGRLGDNTTTDRSSPVSVVGGFTDWSQVSAGNDHSLALTIRC